MVIYSLLRSHLYAIFFVAIVYLHVYCVKFVYVSNLNKIILFKYFVCYYLKIKQLNHIRVKYM